jgi:hypothetical protein
MFSGTEKGHFEVRSLSNKNGYNRGSLMKSIMGRQSPLASVEQNQKFDKALVKRLATILEDLPNLED